MSRLTKKVDNEWKYELDYSCLGVEDNKEHHLVLGDIDFVNKLGQLEDIEEELGMDLVSAIKLRNKVNEQHYVFIQENWGLSKLKFLDDLDIELFNHRLYVNNRGLYFSFDLKEYKKTWWLKDDRSE